MRGWSMQLSLFILNKTWTYLGRGSPGLPGGPPGPGKPGKPCSPGVPKCPKERRIKHWAVVVALQDKESIKPSTSALSILCLRF